MLCLQTFIDKMEAQFFKFLKIIGFNSIVIIKYKRKCLYKHYFFENNPCNHINY